MILGFRVLVNGLISTPWHSRLFSAVPSCCCKEISHFGHNLPQNIMEPRRTGLYGDMHVCTCVHAWMEREGGRERERERERQTDTDRHKLID